MTWTDIDGARQHLNPRLFAESGGRRPSRKVVYEMIPRGLRVVRRGDAEPRRDSQGRMRNGRIIFALEWIDQFLTQTAERTGAENVVGLPVKRHA